MSVDSVGTVVVTHQQRARLVVTCTAVQPLWNLELQPLHGNMRIQARP